MHRFRSLAAAFGAAALLAACSDEPTAPRMEEPPTPPPAQGEYDVFFESAGKSFNVPANLLKAVGYVETRWQMVQGQEEFEGQPIVHGLMGLKGEQLQRGASLAGVSVQAARTDVQANIRAAAALLGAYADELSVNRAELGAWAPAVARYSAIRSPEGQAAYVHNDVYAVLRSGAVARTTSGAVLASLMPVKVTPDFPRSQSQASALACAPDYCFSGTIWRPSPNYNDRPTGDIGKIHMVIIHTCEGSYSSCWSWLTNSDSKVSAHYVVKEDGSEISQLVYEAKRAWHIGSTYDCSLNSDHECWRNGYSNNHFTIGIEHGGFASQTSWPEAQINASAKLSCDISRDNGIPRDKYHILGHAQLQPANRTDPGKNWPWTDYYNKINSYCGHIIVDNNNNNNDTSKGYIDYSANWTGSTTVSGYYATGYLWAKTEAVSDPATFWFYLPAAATKTIDAWWTSASDRSDSAPYIAFDANGNKLGTVYVNQQTNGGKWNQLGSWSFSAGWNKIILSRWTTAGYVVIADAVRIR
jgi:N-acetyl-anhydromuramyl-L-alanine amidase AmpD